ncbi:type I DNA topoisomerase [Egicoccus halophilus]|uniref:DNA topoisomerase 1 n=1 Tax=Egicoccus halophilus TaxID=1670830 RepID=A0A8J3AGE3_9ACTN|nr:type I DNA topoisomerase [Egicoccus halophilus]GGI07718.1 DNA topoisomerase 1 [Egicoccus halophilus]
MADNLVIVESPAKAKTIERYLGSSFKVLASYGHIRDLPRSDFAIEVEDGGDCHLRYEVPEKSKKHVSALKQAAKSATTVWLAPDLDREGEAIAWHIAEILDLDVAQTNRVTFDEITESAIRAAFEAPRRLNTALVDAQQARRAVDRIVGYRLSPVLWRTVASGISAGRVQSVALRLIVDREDEIRAFVPQEYWSFPGAFARDRDGAPEIQANLYAVGEQRLSTPKDLEDKSEARRAKLLVVRSEPEATRLAERARALEYTVAEVRRTEARRNPKPPFKTSTLQGEASKYGFSARQTMAVAQQLYEGINLGGEQVGLITYMRTDSLNLSAQALGEIGSLVRDRFGERYALAEPRRFAGTTKGAQEAHEAIRPTSVNRTPEKIRRYLSDEQARLYELIWKRTVATQMQPAVFDRVSADVVGADAEGELTFRVTGQVEKFDGFLRAYRAVRDEDEEADEVTDRLPQLEQGQRLHLAELLPEQHETSPPPRYSERTLVEALEEQGIGRPSTYASIISTLEQREYVLKESRRFFATALGEVVVSFLKAHFGEIVDVNFTARMEETLDEIAAGDQAWCRTVTGFLDEVDDWVKERKPERPRLPLHHPADCPECGAPMERVFSGKSKQWFASCSRWPDCEGTLPLNDDGTVGEPEPEPEPDEDVRCQECGKPMLLREGRFGKFFGCVDYPKCKGIRNLQQRLMYRDTDGQAKPFRSPTDPNSFMELRTSRYGKPFVGSTGYPDDAFAVWSVPIATPCPACGAPLRPPPRNRKAPVAICTAPKVNHVYDAEDFDLPSVATWTVVEGVEKYDPELGGTPIAQDELPEPIALSYSGEQAPPAKKKSARKKTAAKKTAAKTGAKTSAAKASAKKTGAKKTAKKTARKRS